MQDWHGRSAEDWFARTLSDDLSADEQACFDQWLTDPANAAEYHATRNVWEQAKFAQAHFAGKAQPPAPSPKNRTAWLNWPAAVAASLVVGIAMLLSLDSPVPDYSAEMATAIGERRQLELPDGTAIELGVNSQLRVNFQGAERNVQLVHGEAFFQVAPDPQRPFNVVSNGHRITVVGTAFNVNARRDVTQVLLVQGSVRIDSESTDSLLLKSGEQTEFRAGQPPAPPTIGNPTIALAWRSGKLVFVDTPLTEVVESFENYLPREIAVDPSAALLRVSGVIPIEDGASAMATLASLLPIRVEDTGNAYLIQAQHPLR